MGIRAHLEVRCDDPGRTWRFVARESELGPVLIHY